MLQNNGTSVAEIRQAIQSAHSIGIAAHIRPDGDAVGSLLGLGLSLQAAGKRVQMLLADGVPEPFRYLSGVETIRVKPEFSMDLTIVVDASEMTRVGGVFTDISIPDINIDHHATNPGFGRLNVVEKTAAATSEILADWLPRLDLPINKEIAEALLTGILTDTIGFRTANTSEKTLRLAAELMGRGANMADLYREALLQRSFEAMRYWGAGLENLQREGSMIWTTLSLDERFAASYPGRDDADLINQLGFIQGAEVAVIFIEQEAQRVKVSWRSQTGVDVSEIAVQFGGGGHKAAAGAEINGVFTDVQDKVLEVTRQMLPMSSTPMGQKASRDPHP